MRGFLSALNDLVSLLLCLQDANDYVLDQSVLPASAIFSRLRYGF